MVTIRVNDSSELCALYGTAQMIADTLKRLGWRVVEDYQHGTLDVYTK